MAKLYLIQNRILSEGIPSSPDVKSDRRPAVKVGAYHLTQDSLVGCEVSPDGTIHFARVYEKQAFFGRTQFTLRKGWSDGTFLIKIVIEGGESLVHDCHRVSLIDRVRGGNCAVESQNQYLIELAEGNTLNVFYKDGSVQEFTATHDRLLEQQLMRRDMLWRWISEVSATSGEEGPMAVGTRMIDLLSLTESWTRSYDLQQDRRRVIDAFLQKLQSGMPQEACIRFKEVLKKVDRTLYDEYKEKLQVKVPEYGL